MATLAALSPPVFGGENYELWCVKMKTFLRSQNLWRYIDVGPRKSESEDDTSEEDKMMDARALYLIQQGVSDEIIPVILEAKNAKEAWEILHQEFQGENYIRRSKLESLRKELENLKMKDSESMKDYFFRVVEIVNEMKRCGDDDISLEIIMKKMLVGLPRKYPNLAAKKFLDQKSVYQKKMVVPDGISKDLRLVEGLKYLTKGDKQINFADKVLKFTGSGRMKRRILIVTDFAIYLFDPETHALKRRIALAAVEKICLSELKDNFFSIIIPTEYDLLMASTRKTEIVNVIVDTVKSTSDYEPEVKFSNGFEYNAAADFVKVVQFEEVEGGVKTRILNKSVS